MTRSRPEKFVSLFQAARGSLFAVEELYRRLQAELSAIEGLENPKTLGFPPLITAATIIDFSHRFGSILDALPGINKRSPQMRKLNSALESVEIARNHLQHMRGDLSSNEEINYPILGAISWAEGNRCHTLCAQQPHQASFVSIALNTESLCWSTDYLYQVKTSAIDLSHLRKTLIETYNWLGSQVKFDPPEAANLDWGDSLHLIMEVKKPTEG